MDTMLHDATDALLAGHGFVTLADIGLEARGEDAEAWLNGQVTQDLAGMEVGEARYGLVVTVKGRIQSDLWAARTGPISFLLALPGETAQTVVDHLEQHLVMEEVELELDSDRGFLTGIGAPPQSIPAGFTTYTTRRLRASGFDLCGPKDRLAEAIHTLEARGFQKVPPAAGDLARARRGIPTFGGEFGPSHYPQEAGLAGAVSFTKGCYVGQEVVCMLQNRGRLRRRLARLRAPVAAAIAVDAAVTSEAGASGTVTSVFHDRTESWVFAYLKATELAPGVALSITGSAGQEVEAGFLEWVSVGDRELAG